MLTDTIREYETRARSVRKEPKTAAWIEQYGGATAVLYDIGANVGPYSLIAAARGARVVAFEPAHQNIYKLHENVLLNNLSERIIVVPLALASRSGAITAHVEDRTFGASHGFSLAETVSRTVRGQTLLAMGLDACIQAFSLPEPTMIKIDVDGAEIDVLEGAQTTLKNSKLSSMLIEVDDTNVVEITRRMTSVGFRKVDEERSGRNTTNYIFER